MAPTAAQLETPHYRLELDEVTGAIRRLLHKPTGREMVQQGTGYLLNQAIYEQVTSPGDRNDVAAWGRIGRDAAFRRAPFGSARIVAGEPRPWAESLLVEARGPEGMTLATEIILDGLGRRVDIVNRLHKQPTTRSEALYHAFPLATANGQTYLDVPGGAMRPGLDQVPGTATDWHSIQNWFAVAGDGYTVVVASPDVGLVQCTSINTGRWHESLPPSNGLVMSWVLNNYWFTNFPLRQDGELTYRYSITVQEGPFDAGRAARFGRQIRQRAWAQALRLAPSGVV
jgi:hypothetical protein